MVQFDFDALKPDSVRIPADGTVAWSNIAPDSRGFVVFPEDAASGFRCGVELPCPLEPGTYAYEIWIMGIGIGTTDPGRPERRLPGKIVVE